MQLARVAAGLDVPVLVKCEHLNPGGSVKDRIALAIVLSRTQWNQDIFEGWIMLTAALFVITMIIFMMRTGRKLKEDIEGKLGSLVGQG